MSDDYRIVTIRVHRVLARSVEIDVPSKAGLHYLPRSVIHGGDDLILGRMSATLFPKDVTLRVMSWKADELSLA